MSYNSERIDLSDLKHENQFLSKRHGRLYHRVQTELQRPLSGVHSIMMEKLAQARESGECTPIPFHYIYHHVQSCSICSSWKCRYTLPQFHLYSYVQYSVVYITNLSRKICKPVLKLDFTAHGIMDYPLRIWTLARPNAPANKYVLYYEHFVDK